MPAQEISSPSLCSARRPRTDRPNHKCSLLRLHFRPAARDKEGIRSARHFGNANLITIALAGCLKVDTSQEKKNEEVERFVMSTAKHGATPTEEGLFAKKRTKRSLLQVRNQTRHSGRVTLFVPTVGFQASFSRAKAIENAAISGGRRRQLLLHFVSRALLVKV